MASNAPDSCPVEHLVRVAFCRANVEHAFRVCKSELGFTHFEGRSYTALMRHLSLCVATLAFVAEHTDRLRGEKPAGDGRAGVPGVGAVEPGVAEAGSRDRRTRVGVGGHHLPPTPQPRRHPVQATTSRSPTHTQNTQSAKTQTQGKVYRYIKVAL